MKTSIKAMLTALGVVAMVAGTVACSSDSGGSTGTLTIENAWARTSAASQQMGAVYLTITSPVDDALVSASVDASVAAKAEIHETMSEMTGSTMAGDMGGSMMMHKVDEIALPAGEAVALKPGGYHVMLIDLAGPLTTGNTISVTLTMKSGSTTTVEAEVREDAP